MPKQVVADVFETLGGMAAQTGKQAVANVKKTTEDVAQSLGVKPDQSPAQDNQTLPPAHTKEQYEKIEKAAQQRSTARYRQIQEEIKLLEEKRRQELPKQVTGQPGFSEEKAVKQLTEQSEEKDKLPPLPVRKASRKAEMFRGASG